VCSYAGIDWASEKHDVLIEDETGERLLGETFRHDEQGIAALCDALRCFEVELVAIERPDGVLVAYFHIVRDHVLPRPRTRLATQALLRRAPRCPPATPTRSARPRSHPPTRNRRTSRLN
jgi:N-dimethylarginine dimethylaminohydrolase